ncbi:hypothetical protein HDU90_004290 [Geranomyces variabilis]|nr:hypothetical protein HDU90_004290 [Geranomyces variabilis]
MEMLENPSGSDSDASDSEELPCVGIGQIYGVGVADIQTFNKGFDCKAARTSQQYICVSAPGVADQ